MADNVLRVGAEFDVAPLIAGAEAAGVAFEEIKAKLLALAKEADASGSVMVAQAARIMATGVSAKDTTSVLVNLGSSEKDAASAADVAARSVGLAGIEIGGESSEADRAAAANTRLAASFAEADAGAQGTVNAAAASRVELGALSGSAGAAEFGLARIAGQSKLLAPIIQAAFPVFAILAFLEILDQAAKKLAEWDDLAQKSADAQAAFTREMLKSVDSLDKAREQFAGLSGTAAAAAVELAHAGEKSADLESQVKKLNERLADQPGFWKSIEESVGHVAVDTYHLFDDAAERAERSNEDFNREIGNTIKQAKDLPGALEAVRAKITELQNTYDNPALAAYSESTQENLKRQIDLYQQWATSIQNIVTAQGLSTQEIYEKTAKEVFDSEQKLTLTRITLEQQEAEASHRLNITTAEEQRDVLLKLSEEKTRIIETGIARDRALLESQAKAQPGVDFSAQRSEISDRAAAAEIESTKERLRIATEADQEIKRRDEERAVTSIEADQKEIAAADHASEAYARMRYERAQSGPEVESTSADLEQRILRTYEDQITALKLKADALRQSDPVANERQIVELGAQEVELDAQKETAIRELRQQTADKIREIDRKELDQEISSYNDHIAVLKSRYEEEAQAAKTGADGKKADEKEYVTAVGTLAEDELAKTLSIYAQESDAVRAGVAQRIITEQEASVKLAAIWSKQAESYDLYQKRLSQLAAQEAQKREQTLKKESETVARDFTQAFDRIVTGQEKVGQGVVKLAASIELSLIENGIKKVVAHYTEQLIELIAAHSSFLAKILGLDTAGDAAQLAQAKAVQSQIVLYEAGESYAAAFASVMAALPFPANIAAAPGAAAAAAAQTIAGGLSFEYGGIIPGPVGAALPIIAHGQEGVLNQKVTSLVNNSNASSSSTSNGPTNIRMENHFYKTGDISEAAIARNVMRGVKRGKIALR